MLWLSLAFGFELQDYDWSSEAAPIERPFLLDLASFPDGFADPEILEAAVVEALSLWNRHPDARFYARYGGILAESAATTAIVISYAPLSPDSRKGEALCSYEVPPTPGAPGIATECSIRMFAENDAGPVDWHVSAEASQEGSDFTAILAHEVGHVAGLGHSGVPGAIMEATLDGARENRSLAIDDEAGLTALYGTATIAYEVAFDEAGIAADAEEVEVFLTNTGDKSAVQPTLSFSGGPAFLVSTEPVRYLGDLPPGEVVSVFVPIEVGGCLTDTFEITAQVTDDNGSLAQVSTSVPIECPIEEPEPADEPERSGCTTAPSASWSGWLRR